MESFLIYLLKSSTILSLFYLVYFFLLRKDTFFTLNRHFLLSGILCAILLPFLEFTTIEYIERPIIEHLDISSSLIEVDTTPEKKTINWWFIGFSSYLLISSLLLSRFGIQLLSLKKIFTTVSEKTKEGFLFIKTHKDIPPFSFFKYIIFNPNLHQPSELDLILKHEKVHAKQYHTLDLLIMHLTVIFQWINPLVWAYKKSLEQNLEFIADQESTRDLSSKKEYQLALVKVCSNNYSSITNNFYQSLIKKRIVMLNKKQSNHKNLWKVTVILPLLSLFLWGFNTKTEIKYTSSPTIENTPVVKDVVLKKETLLTTEKTFPVKKKEKSSKSLKAYPSKKNVKTFNSEKKQNKAIASEHYSLAEKTTETTLSNRNKNPKETIEFIISRTSTQEDLDRIKRVLKNEYKIDINFKSIRRNNNNEITSIGINMNSKKSNANFSIENETPISSIVISYDSKNDKMGIGQSGSKNIWVKGKKGKKEVTIYEIDGDDEDSENNIFIVEDKKNKQSKITIKRSDEDGTGANIFVQSDDNGTIFDFDDDTDDDPIFYIDGKEASKKEMKKLKSNDIESINVIKGKKAVKAYGKKAKQGVIEITTKKKVRKGTGLKIKKNKNTYPSALTIKKGDDVKIYSKDKVLFTDKNTPSPSVYVDGKKVKYTELQSIDRNAIKSVTILKNISAMTKYGNDAENGVIEITTK